jgi:hypothetical protein
MRDGFRAALLALSLIPMPALAIAPKCFLHPPVPARCIFGPAGPGFPEGTMALTCGPVLPQAEEVKP